MQRSIWGRVCRGLFVLAMVLATASAASAQSIVDAGRVEFTPSIDHNAVDPTTGVPLVQGYSLEIFLAGGATPVRTVNLGKPAPDVDGMIRRDFVPLLSTPLTPGVIYEAEVSAVGPGGSADSTRSNTFAFSLTCPPSISPTSQWVPAAGVTGSSTVSAGLGCGWTAVSNVAWITVITGASGSGSGAVTFSVAANAGTTRTGTLTIGGNTFTVTQDAAPCSYTIAPTSANVAPTSVTGSVAVTAATGCAWTATSNTAWITINTGASGTGNGAVTYTAAANPGITPRTGTLTIAGKTFTVNQTGAPCAPTISPASANVVSAGVTGTVAVTAAIGCTWTASSNAPWITLDDAISGGSGGGSVTYTVAANPATTPRTGTLTVGGNTFAVIQAAASCSYVIAPTSASVATAGVTDTVTVSALQGCTWTATSNASWIAISAGATGSGDGSVTYTVTANPGTTSRTGTLTVGGNTFTVTQAGTSCSYVIAPTSAPVATAGGTGTVTVSALQGCTWTATSNASWIAISAGATGSGDGSVTYTVTANPGTMPRIGTLTVGGNTFTVTQAGTPCAPTISPMSANVLSTGGAGSVTVAAAIAADTTPCGWTAASNATWITVTANAIGRGNGLVTYTVAANATTSSRTGTLTIADNTFTVTQAAVPCSFTITPTSVNIVAAGSTETVTVTAATGCAWTATSNTPWITISAGANGSGNDSVTYTVAANPGTASRFGTVTVGGNVLTVTQAGSTCAPTISPTSATVVEAGVTGSVAVTAATGCAWTATSNATWITISAGAAGNGNGSVTYSVAANPGTTPRTGTLTIGGNAFTVTQAGAPCAPAISPTSASVVAAGITDTVAVTAATGCTWTATSNAPWITISAGATGSGNGSVTYTVAANPGTAPRTGTLTIGGNAFTVTQGGTSCAPTISPTSATVVDAGVTGTIAVTAATGCAWTATSNAPWITISAGAAGDGNGSVTYDVAANPGTSRTGTLTIGGSTFTVIQAGTTCAPTVSPTSATVVDAGVTGTIAVTAATGCAWTATSNAPWITISAGATGSGNGSVTYDVAPNPGAARTGTLTVGGNTFTVTQAGASCAPTISPTSHSLPANGGSGVVSVTNGAACSWTATSDSSWVTITSGASRTGSGTVGYTATANTTGTPRTATLTIAGMSFLVTEPSASCTFAVTPSLVIPPPAGSTATLTVTTQPSCAWTTSSSASWITVTASGTGSGTGTYTVSANTGPSTRSGTISVAGVLITVIQNR